MDLQRRTIEETITEIERFSMNDSHIESVIMAGSYASGTYNETSDLDLCIITTNKAEMIENSDWVQAFGESVSKQIEYYGACTSVRVWYKDGWEIEFGIVEPSWIALPLDSGTEQVLSDGYQVITDKKQYFQNLK